MNKKNLLKAFLIIVPITIIITFFANKFNWFGVYYFTTAFSFTVLIIFGLTCIFMQLFKSKIKPCYIFLFIILGTALGFFSSYFPFKTKLLYIFFYFSFLLIAILFGWGANVIKNRFIRVSFWFIGIFYMQIYIMNEYELELIEWLMYIPAFILGIWACKKYGYEKKLLLLPLLLWFLNAVFQFSVIVISIISDKEASVEDIAIGHVLYQIVTSWALWLVYCCGFWFIKTKKLFIKILLPVVVIALALFLFNFVRIELLQKFENKSWTGEISKPAQLSDLEFFTDSTLTNKVTVNDLNKRIYVLDFSNPGCGNCFRQMPKFQKIAEKYKKHTDIGFYTIYVFNDTADIAWFQQYTEKHNITTPHLFINAKDSIYNQTFNYHRFPQYNIVKNDTIIFDGYLKILGFFKQKYLK